MNRSLKFGYVLLTAFLSFQCYSQKQLQGSAKEIFESKCAKCHGKDGAKGAWGAINLQYSYIGDSELFNTISNGRRIMPTWRKRLSVEQIKMVMGYIKTFRK